MIHMKTTKPTLAERISAFVHPTGHQQQASKIKGQTPILRSDEVATWNSHFFGLQDSARMDVLKSYRKIYRSGGIVRAAIDTYTLFMFSGGWTLQSSNGNESVVDQITEIVFNKRNTATFNQVILQIAQDAISVGDGYAKILTGSGINSSIPIALQQLPGERVHPHIDASNTPQWYEMYDSNLSQIIGTMNLSDILHVSFSPSGVEECGVGLLESAWDDICNDVTVAEGSAAAIRRHGFGIWHVKINSTDPETPVETSDIEAAKQMAKKLTAKTEIVTTGNIDIVPLNETGQTNVTTYADWSVLRLCTALGIPGELLGLRQGSTDATAVTRIENFYKKIQTYQTILADAVNTQFIDRILAALGKEPGCVWIEFADPSPEDNIKRSTYLQTIAALTPGDPFGLMSQQQMQNYLGIDHEEWLADEEFNRAEPFGVNDGE